MKLGRSIIYILLFTGCTINYIDRVVLSVSASHIQTEFGLSTVELGYLFSAFLWSFVNSFDEVVIASFVAGDEVTFPVYLYSQLRLPRQLPQVIAVAVVVLTISAIVVTISEVLRRMTDRSLEETTRVHDEEEVSVA